AAVRLECFFVDGCGDPSSWPSPAKKGVRNLSLRFRTPFRAPRVARHTDGTTGRRSASRAVPCGVLDGASGDADPVIRGRAAARRGAVDAISMEFLDPEDARAAWAGGTHCNRPRVPAKGTRRWLYRRTFGT